MRELGNAGFLLWLLGIPATVIQLMYQAYRWIRYAEWDNYTLPDLVLEVIRAHHLTPGWWESPQSLVMLHRLVEILPLAAWLIIIGMSLQGVDILCEWASEREDSEE